MTEEKSQAPQGLDVLTGRGGFQFRNVKRNEMLAKAGVKAPRVKKTGTTIAGITFKNGVVLGADTRATEGSIVCDKNCIKIHKISDNIYCCGAGTSADTENVTALVQSGLELHRLDTGQMEPRVVTAMTRLKQRLFQYQGHISAALVLGGVDVTGPHIYTVYPHGSTDKLPYATMGSGSLAAMAVFEQGYKDDMDEKEAVDLVDKAIQSGIFNDLGSGSNVDICVISRKPFDPSKPKEREPVEVKFLRNYATPNERLYRRKAGYEFPPGTTEVIKQSVETFKSKVDVYDSAASAAAPSKPAAMDTSA
jgi:20S proteasome subunit beta 2